MFNTRIAPSPTGYMHIGTIRTAYFNWLAARATGGKFLLRIDDTDLARSEDKYVDGILDTMSWLGLDYDKVSFQSDMFDRYKSCAETLVDQGFALVDDGAYKLCLADVKNIPNSWTDEIVGSVQITKDNVETADGMVLIKSDGSPSYNFASVLDDMDLNINYIIRGSDHVTNTARQVILFHILGGKLPKFAHVGLIGLNGKPLSKRDGAAGVNYYREKGYDPEAVLNFVARLGWGPTKDDKTTALLPRERMLELFLEGGKMKPSLANMDLVKLDSFDRKYKGRKGIKV